METKNLLLIINQIINKVWFVSCLRQVKYSLVVLKCTLTTPMSSLGWLQFRRQQICSLSPTRDKSGHVRSLAMVQNQTRICAQSKLRSS